MSRTQDAKPTDPLKTLDRGAMMKELSQRFSYPIIEDHPDNARFSQELVVGHRPFGEAAEAIRSIRSGIASSALAQGTRSFLVVGSRSGDGTTYLASNLAVAFAQMSIPTLLIDTNLRSPRVGQLFGIPTSEEGLSEMLNRKSENGSLIKGDIISQPFDPPSRPDRAKSSRIAVVARVPGPDQQCP